VQAGTAAFVGDTFQNMAANLGYGTNNLSSGASYGFNPLSRNRNLLEWMYRGSWLVRKVVDCPADDMTREGIAIESDMAPDQIDEFTAYWTNLQLWQRMNATLKWARLYGGALCVLMIDGQDMSTPLRLDTVGKGQFQGLLVLDRWMVWPKDKLVKDYGADYGRPEQYEVVADARSVPRMTIHHTRCIRFDGVELPYWQKMAENDWGLSVIEPLWDRMIAFDSATQGAAQLIYKAHLRILKLPQYRELVASGGPLFQAVLKQIHMIRAMQTNEGLTVIDAEDEFDSQSYSFAGLSDMMIQFGQQVSGAADVPMTRMFGQSPAGMNSTGESDLRNYYDGVKSHQEFRLRRPVKMLLDVTHRSLYGLPLPKGFNYSFKPLWQLTEETKAQIASSHAQSIDGLLQSGVFTPVIALKEIRQSSRITGFGSNVTDEDIEAAASAPPPMPDMGGGMPGQEGAPQGQEGAPGAAPPGAPPGLPAPPGGQGQAALPAPDGGQAQAGAQPPAQLPAPAVASGSTLEVTKRRSLAKLLAKAIHRIATGGPPVNSTTGAQPTDSEVDDSLDPPETTAHIRLHEGVTARVHLPGTHVNFDHVTVGGMDVVVETPKGDTRRGYGWTSDGMPAAYGYIDGADFDAFVGPNPNSDQMWVIEQVDPVHRTHDSYKAMLGYDFREQALVDFRASFSEDRLGIVRGMGVDVFRDWLRERSYG
jgi:hypothetical protein